MPAGFSVNQRRPSLREALHQLTLGFAEGVLDAVRTASFIDLVALFDQETHPSPAARHRPARARPVPRRRTTPAQPEPSGDATAEPIDPATIIDPASVLAALERAAERMPRDAWPLNQEETPAAVVPPFSSTEHASPAPRAGEDVLRTTAGGLVLRRQRRPSPVPAA